MTVQPFVNVDSQSYERNQASRHSVSVGGSLRVVDVTFPLPRHNLTLFILLMIECDAHTEIQ